MPHRSALLGGLALLCALAVGAAAPGHALAEAPAAPVTYASSASGAWNDPATWGGAGVPTADDDVVIADGHTVGIPVSAAAASLVIGAGAAIQNHDSYGVVAVLRISGDVLNHGSVLWQKPYPSPEYLLAMEVGGDILNAGVWDAQYTALTGSQPQRVTLQGAGAADGLRRTWVDMDPASPIVAGSDLTFHDRLELRGARLEMGGHTLTLGQNPAFGGASLTGQGGEATVSGVVAFDGGALTVVHRDPGRKLLEEVRVEGEVTLSGEIDYGLRVVFGGPVEIAAGAVLRRAYDADGTWTVTFENDVLNLGTVAPCAVFDCGADRTGVDLGGSLANEGTWTPARTRLVGTTDQTLTSTGPLGGLWLDDSPASATAAGSDLAFSSGLELRGSRLEMGAHTLSIGRDPGLGVAVPLTGLGGGATVAGVVAFDGGALRVLDHDAAQTMAEAVRVEGAVAIHGTLDFGLGVVFGGPVEIAEDAVIRRAYGADATWTIRFEGDVLNRGEVAPCAGFDCGADRTAVDLGGSLTNEGIWAPSASRFVGEGYHDLIARAALAGPLTLEDPARTLVGRVELPVGLHGSLADYDVLTAVLTATGTTGLDSIHVASFGDRAPATFGNAVRGVWTLRPTPAGAEVSLPALTLRYRDAGLGANDEAALQVYHSLDDGQTWTQASTSANLTRDPDANTVTLAGAGAYGTYAVSSRADPISVRPNVVFSIVGTDRIRVGPPNRYSLTYLNAGATPTGDFAVGLTTAGGIYIESLTPSPTTPGVAPQPLLSAHFSHTGDSTHAVLYVPSLRPGEERTMTADLRTRSDIGLRTGGASGLGGASLSAAGGGGPLIGFLGAVAQSGAQGYLKDMWKATMIELVENPEDASHAPDRAFDRVNDATEWSVEKGAGEITGALRDELGDLTGRGTTFERLDAVKEVAEFIQDLLDANARREERWRRAAEGAPLGPDGGTFAGLRVPIPPVELPSAPPKTPEPVRSWDPNEKLGPQGVGDAGFVASLGRARYTIKFENLAAATAPAYEVVIVDTLSAAFDAASVAFGATSWDGFVMERVGNVLRWRATGIELPPNVAPPEGEGFVEFTVDVVPGLGDGAVLANHATIWFDINPPIVTNTHRNTLDHSAPATVMAALPDESTGPEVTVRWAAADLDPSGAPGAGVQTTTLFVSRDGGPFLPATTTEAGEAAVPGELGSTYAFYALSADAVGNAEAARPTIVQTRFVAPTASGPAGGLVFGLAPPAPNPFGQATRLRFTLARSAEVSLVAYDALGRRVSVLAAGDRTAGAHEVLWDASGLASGVYVLHLRQGDEEVVQRALVVR